MIVALHNFTIEFQNQMPNIAQIEQGKTSFANCMINNAAVNDSTAASTATTNSTTTSTTTVINY